MNKIDETSYVGNIGIMELIKFHNIATSNQKKELRSHLDQKKKHDAWKLIQHVTGNKLHKTVAEEHGAGEDGTEKLVRKYLADTPGQTSAVIKRYKKTK